MEAWRGRVVSHRAEPARSRGVLVVGAQAVRCIQRGPGTAVSHVLLYSCAPGASEAIMRIRIHTIQSY